MISIAIEVDTTLHTAYIQLSNEAVTHTVELSEDILIDLDALNVVVGIELLDDNAPLPFDRLLSDYHVHTEVIDLLRLIRPTVSSYLEMTHGNDGATKSRPAAQLQPA